MVWYSRSCCRSLGRRGRSPRACSSRGSNADNHQLLGAESSLDEVRVHEALKDESPALLHELQRLEYKLNILLRLTAELALRSSGLPRRRAGAPVVARRWSGSAQQRRASGSDRPAVAVHQFRTAAAAEDSVHRGRASAAVDGARVAQLRFAD